MVFAVNLSEYTLSARHAHIIALLVDTAFFRTHITKRRIECQGQSTNHLIDLANGRKLSKSINLCAFVDWFQACGKSADLRNVVILLDVFARAGDGECIEELEVVEIHHFHKPLRGTILL